LITKEKARKNISAFESHSPVTRMSDINALIDVASMMGMPALSIYIPIKKLQKFKTSLRDRGFGIEYVQFKAMPDVLYFTVYWDISDFVAGDRGLEEV
jgi:hypothetical protein